MHSGPTGTVAARGFTRPATGGAWIHAPPQENLRNQGCPELAMKVPSPAKGENTDKLVDFISPFCYRSAFGSLFLLLRRRFCCKGEPLLWWS